MSEPRWWIKQWPDKPGNLREVLGVRNKYRNKKTVIDGHTFDSKKEAARYGELKTLAKSGNISDLEIQPVFILQDSFRDNRVGLCKDGKPRTVRAVKYTADFKYFDNDKNKVVVEDVKSKASKTEAYVVRRALFLKQNPSVDFIET